MVGFISDMHQANYIDSYYLQSSMLHVTDKLEANNLLVSYWSVLGKKTSYMEISHTKSNRRILEHKRTIVEND